MGRRSVLVGVLLLTVGLLSGCPKKPEVGQAGPAAIGPQAGVPAAPPAAAPAPRAGDIPVTRPAPPAEAAIRPAPPAVPASPTAPAAVPLRDIFFDYDKSNVRDDQKAALNENVAWLKANPAVKITIEGHADERGTNEYNLALGERRAKATKDYLVATGIEATRIATISYGEERPFVLGHDESAWKWNRRAHFVITWR
ncbi:MAG: peptidoglycan-associated lipoprotein Pal [candidate division NC10 bacterium]|nr:peptidoglycan-associated lipoprotein Pal [candidate division NC10 bacterium]